MTQQEYYTVSPVAFSCSQTMKLSQQLVEGTTTGYITTHTKPLIFQDQPYTLNYTLTQKAPGFIRDWGLCMSYYTTCCHATLSYVIPKDNVRPACSLFLYRKCQSANHFIKTVSYNLQDLLAPALYLFFAFDPNCCSR